MLGGMAAFVEVLGGLGFAQKRQADTSNQMFVLFQFRKEKLNKKKKHKKKRETNDGQAGGPETTTAPEAASFAFKSCRYKKR